jgi:predicted MFS family arabinose efflux permease
MTTYFIGGAVGSQTGAIMYERFGWIGVCWAGAGFVAIALIVLLSEALIRDSRFEIRD